MRTVISFLFQMLIAPAFGKFAIRELWRYKKLYSTGIYPAGTLAVSAPVTQTIELTKYAQEDFISRLLIRVSGNIVVTTGGGGAATGKPNPEGLLVAVNQFTTPQLNAMNPVTNLSARGLLIDNEFMRGYLRTGTAIPDTTGTQAVDTLYEIYYKRPNARRGVEFSHSIAKYSSDLLQLQFGGREQLFTGGTGTWDLSGLTLSIYTDSDFAVDSDRIHNHELFERFFPILASQTDFPIDTLPQGYLYTDLIFIGEVSNALNNTVINNINIEGGGRVWAPLGEQNAPVVQRAVPQYRNIITDPSYSSTGIYPFTLRDGMFSRAIDALTSPLSIKLDVTFQAGAAVRLVGRRMVPGVSRKSNPGAGGAKPVVTALPSR